MKHVDFWFDPVSPFAYLAFERLPQALAGLSVTVRYRPVLFAAMLKHWGQKGPAEIEPKRAWTFRHLAWQAQQMGVSMRLPDAHPFNPLPLLRLGWACADALGTPNRRVVQALFNHVWGDGGDASDPGRLAALHAKLAPANDPASDAVKACLRDATDAAIAAGVFGVPTLRLDGRLYWGLDALPMVAAALRADPWFASDAWDEAGRERPGVVRGDGSS